MKQTTKKVKASVNTIMESFAECLTKAKNAGTLDTYGNEMREDCLDLLKELRALHRDELTKAASKAINNAEQTINATYRAAVECGKPTVAPHGERDADGTYTFKPYQCDENTEKAVKDTISFLKRNCHKVWARLGNFVLSSCQGEFHITGCNFGDKIETAEEYKGSVWDLGVESPFGEHLEINQFNAANVFIPTNSHTGKPDGTHAILQMVWGVVVD